jgi:L-threonylcarbamoyladenylate synthase
VTAAAFERCIGEGQVAVFPADTVYGLACDPEDPDAVRRLYELKGRPPDKPAALMFFDRDAMLATLPDLGRRTRAVAQRLLPARVTLLLPNPAGRFPLAGGGPVLGLRVPDLPALASVRRPVLQTSANLSGAPDARSLDEVPESIRAGAGLVIDGGALPGVPSTVIDLRRLDEDGTWSIARHGAVPEAEIAAAIP